MAVRDLIRLRGARGGDAKIVEDDTGVTHLNLQGNDVVGPQQAAISDPTGGATVDSQARTAISSILTALRAHGLIA